MKKRLLALTAAMIMTASALVACGNDAAAPAADANTDAATDAATDDTAAPADGEDAPAEQTYESTIDHVATDDGNVLNIYVWNEEFKTRVAGDDSHEPLYPGYEVVDATTGKIGDVQVNWIINANEGNNYQDKLDAQIEKQLAGSLDAADKIDIFLVEADYALKYTGSDATLAMSEVGLDDSVFADQFQYTKDVVTFNGELKGSSWQGCPAVLIYNRAAATEVLGSDDPATVQAAVADWATFKATADKMNEAGYSMCATINDTFRVYSNNVKTPWVVDGKINIDDNLMNWVNDSKALVDAGEATTEDLWGDTWSKGFYPDNELNVFCYFGPAWFFNFSMKGDDPSSIAANGGWGVVKGPQAFFWGGTWMCAANGTDNKTLVADMIKVMTTDDEVLKNIVTMYDDFTNDSAVMQAVADDATYANAMLGGQNPVPEFMAGVSTIDLSNISAYDQGCNEEFQKAMKDYFTGNADLDTALNNFYTNIEAKYPALSH